MTREEALLARENNYYSTVGQENTTDDVEDLINQIYDDFDSRICKNCKYWQDYTDTLSICCNGTLEFRIATPKNFGCNKFERS